MCISYRGGLHHLSRWVECVPDDFFFPGGQAIVLVECWHLRGEMHCWENGPLWKKMGDGLMELWLEMNLNVGNWIASNVDLKSVVSCRSCIPVRLKWLSQGDESWTKQWSCVPCWAFRLLRYGECIAPLTAKPPTSSLDQTSHCPWFSLMHWKVHWYKVHWPFLPLFFSELKRPCHKPKEINDLQSRIVSLPSWDPFIRLSWLVTRGTDPRSVASLLGLGDQHQQQGVQISTCSLPPRHSGGSFFGQWRRKPWRAFIRRWTWSSRTEEICDLSALQPKFIWVSEPPPKKANWPISSCCQTSWLQEIFQLQERNLPWCWKHSYTHLKSSTA